MRYFHAYPAICQSVLRGREDHLMDDFYTHDIGHGLVLLPADVASLL